MKKYHYRGEIYFFGLVVAILFLAVSGGGHMLLNNEKDGNISKESELVISPISVSPDKDRTASIIFVGDIMTSRTVEQKMKIRGYDYPFSVVKEYLSSSDLVFGNLETPLTSGSEVGPGEVVFRSDPRVAEALTRANIRLVSLANNHSMNFGAKGIGDTFQYLNEAGIDFVGAGWDENMAYAPKYFEMGGIKFAFLAFTDTDVLPPDSAIEVIRPGVATMNLEKAKKAIQETKLNADVTIVSMHSGTEYTEFPNQRQINFAHGVVDAGADLVIGHHPHWAQPIENYKGKYIFYSLGNFVFDQMWSLKTREGKIIKVNFNQDGVADYEIKDILIEDYAQPRLVN
jgi:poly-gamma-glutamate synthesis protein (capsule biosynthesis protein)